MTTANAELADANTAVKARFDLAREAIGSFQDGVNEDDMLKGEELKGLRNKLLRSAARFYEKLEKLLQGQTDRPSRAILAQTYFELGELTEKIGIQPEALAVHRKAVAIRRDTSLLARRRLRNGELDLRPEPVRPAGPGCCATPGDIAGAFSAFEEGLGFGPPARPMARRARQLGPATSSAPAATPRIGSVPRTPASRPRRRRSYRRALAIQ